MLWGGDPHAMTGRGSPPHANNPMYPLIIQHLLKIPLKIYRTSIEHLSKINRKSIEHLSNIYRKSIENRSRIYRTSIENQSKWHTSASAGIAKRNQFWPWPTSASAGIAKRKSVLATIHALAMQFLRFRCLLHLDQPHTGMKCRRWALGVSRKHQNCLKSIFRKGVFDMLPYWFETLVGVSRKHQNCLKTIFS